MESYSKEINSLIENLSLLPGIGVKTATRLAFYIINADKEYARNLSKSILEARDNVKFCKECYTLTDDELCPICKSVTRDHSTIMVVETPQDMEAYEKTGKYNGVYHVLHGHVSPAGNMGPQDIKLRELMKRLSGNIKEVIIATNSSLEGETTALYIADLIKPTGIKITRIASGIPAGGELENIDEITLSRALEGRRMM